MALVGVQFAIGVTMLVRASWLDIWDATTNTLYSSHKLLGVLLFFLIVVRLAYRFIHGAPPDEPSLERWQKLASHVTHWAIYTLLLAVPVIGWFGVQLFPALDVFGWLSLPAIIAPDTAASGWVLRLHGIAAFVLLWLLASHVAAALFHHFIRKDGVLVRMVPWLGRRDRP